MNDQTTNNDLRVNKSSSTPDDKSNSIKRLYS